MLAFGISFMSGTGGKLGWSWIFVSAHDPDASSQTLTKTKQILEGIFTIAAGIFSSFSMYRLPFMVVRADQSTYSSRGLPGDRNVPYGGRASLCRLEEEYVSCTPSPVLLVDSKLSYRV